MQDRSTVHNRRRERDACGVGFVADARGRASRSVVDLLLAGLHNVRHRGAVAADGKTGDGAGVLLPIPAALVPAPWCGLGMVFLRDESAREGIEAACRAEGIELGGWRPVPVEPEALGEQARACAPRIEQLVLLRPTGTSEAEAERRAYRARRRASQVPGAYVASLSFRTVTYKALCAADQLAAFYPDLRDPALAVPFGIFHQRFSTNTTPSWERAQPFRLLCHNGEINAIEGNVNWMRARVGSLGLDEDASSARCIDESGSDSAMLDNALELLVRGGRDVRHALTMLVPRAVAGRSRARPRACAPSTATTPRSSSRGTGRPASSSPTAASSVRRSTATGCGRCATRSPTTASSSAPPRPARSTSRAAPSSGAAGSAPARCSRSIPSGSASRRPRDQARLAARRPYGRWLDDRAAAGRRTASPWRRRTPDLTRAPGARSATRARRSR